MESGGTCGYPQDKRSVEVGLLVSIGMGILGCLRRFKEKGPLSELWRVSRFVVGHLWQISDACCCGIGFGDDPFSLCCDVRVWASLPNLRT